MTTADCDTIQIPDRNTLRGLRERRATLIASDDISVRSTSKTTIDRGGVYVTLRLLCLLASCGLPGGEG